MNMNNLDKLHLADVQKRHPRSSILVLRGFLDGEISHKTIFGSQPADWDGTQAIYDFRLVNLNRRRE